MIQTPAVSRILDLNEVRKIELVLDRDADPMKGEPAAYLNIHLGAAACFTLPEAVQGFRETLASLQQRTNVETHYRGG